MNSILAGYIRNVPIRNQLFIYFIIFSILPLSILGVVSYRNASAIIEQQSFQYSQTILRETMDRSEQMLDDLARASTLLVTSSEMNSPGFENSDYGDFLKYFLEIKSNITRFKNNRSEVASVFLCLVSDGKIISPDNFNQTDMNEFQNYAAIKNIIDKHIATSLSGMHKNEFIGDSAVNPYVMTLSKAVFDNFNVGFNKVLVINISEDTVRKMCSIGIEGVDNSLYIIDRNGQAVYYKDRSLYGKNVENGYINNILQMEKHEGGFLWNNVENEIYVSYIYSPKTDWIYINELPVGYLIQNSIYIRNLTLGLIFLCGLVSFIFAFFLATNFTSPVKKMLASFKQVEAGRFDTKVDIKQQNEFGILALNYNNMLDEISSLLKKVQEESNMKRQFELDALQAQIAPHFLYNTLNSIKCLSRSYEDDRIFGITSSLIELLQLSISKDSTYITVEEELYFTKSYLYLQSIRNEGRFKALYEVDESLLKCKTLKLLVQPLVENSLLHGLDFNSTSPLIVIRVYTSGGDVCFDVEDNGTGIDQDKIASLMSGNAKGVRGRFSGIGINNVNERIKIHFGAQYGISLKSEVGSFTIATVRIPYFLDESELV